MKRGYTSYEFREKLNELVSINPLTLIGTDIIVGFLGEDDDDFEDTYKFLRDSPISKFHIFRFSRREKTVAFHLSKRLSEPTPSTKLKRAKILAKLGQEKYEQFLSKHVGLTIPALFLEKRVENFQEALLDNHVPVFIKTTKDLKGKIKNIKIVRGMGSMQIDWNIIFFQDLKIRQGKRIRH